MSIERWDAIILGAGAAGLFCAGIAAERGARVLVADHAAKPGEKIRISGGGRCNFTNIHTAADRFLSANPHFAKSALARYTAADFVRLIDAYGIPHHEKTLGQLFCDHSARDVIDMLLAEMARVGATLRLATRAVDIDKTDGGFRLTLETEGRRTIVATTALVIATGGKSIPKMGATGFGYQIAERFGLPIVETRPGLAPLTFGGETLEGLKALAGVAAPVIARSARAAFEEAALFTHRGLSGPAVLQISSYWREGETISLSFAPGTDLLAALKRARSENGARSLAGALGDLVPKRLARHLAANSGWDRAIGGYSDKRLAAVADALGAWTLKPTGSEGYRTAEVTLGGVSTEALDAKTMAAKAVAGLYFIGEVVDVTGWLGGYNFQWAWSSAAAAGRAIAAAART